MLFILSSLLLILSTRYHRIKIKIRFWSEKERRKRSSFSGAYDDIFLRFCYFSSPFTRYINSKIHCNFQIYSRVARAKMLTHQKTAKIRNKSTKICHRYSKLNSSHVRQDMHGELCMQFALRVSLFVTTRLRVLRHWYSRDMFCSRFA